MERQMSDETKTEEKTSAPDTSKVDELSRKVDELFELVRSNHSTSGTKTEVSSVDSQVQAALAAARAKDAEEAEKTNTANEIKAIKEKLETKPRQVRNITKRFWGED
jgi:hypothetical protein